MKTLTFNIKHSVAIIILLFITITAFGQNPADSGFTNKAEAKNQTIKGLKQGKWLEYPGATDDAVSSDSNAPYYILNYYKDGKRIGISRWYLKSDGTLFLKEWYKNGVQEGLAQQFYSSGKVQTEVNFTNGKPNGVMRRYFEDGNLSGERTFVNGQGGDDKNYEDTGNNKSNSMNAYRQQMTKDSLKQAEIARKQALAMKAKQDSAAVAQRYAKTSGASTAPQASINSNGAMNQNGMNKIMYIDNKGAQATGAAMSPAAEGNNPSWTADWTKTDNLGNPMGDKKLYKTFSYLGSNGSNYQTRIVASATGDPNKRFEVHFQSKKLDGEDEFHNGRVVILDWNHNPWEVKVNYSNDQGIFFVLNPVQH